MVEDGDKNEDGSRDGEENRKDEKAEDEFDFGVSFGEEDEKRPQRGGVEEGPEDGEDGVGRMMGGGQFLEGGATKAFNRGSVRWHGGRRVGGKTNR